MRIELGVPRLRHQVARPALLWPSLALACHAWVFKWHTQVRIESWSATPSTPSGTPKCLSLWIDELACHAPWFKWHAHSVCWAWRAMPNLAYHNPLVAFSIALWKTILACHARLGVPCPFSGLQHCSLETILACHAQLLACHAHVKDPIMLLWKTILACHAQLLACHAHTLSWHFLQVARQFHMPSFILLFSSIFVALFT
ncbi:hypothetical protein AHAS_Ahas11G0196100 [Arachis hypogaea]